MPRSGSERAAQKHAAQPRVAPEGGGLNLRRDTLCGVGYPTIRHGEECMRDGMQIEDRNIPVADKIRLLDALSDTGLEEIAVGSFASPKWTPRWPRSKR
jgi:hypothetical protein